MRRAKIAAQQRARQRVVHHTPAERLAMTRKKRKEGPSGLKRAARRKAKQIAHAEAKTELPRPEGQPEALDPVVDSSPHAPTEGELADVFRPEEETT